MELIVFDKNFVQLSTLDTFKSLIWSDRYFGYGDFDIVSDPDSNIISDVNGGRYVALVQNTTSVSLSEHLMIIESVQIKTDIESGNEVIVKGRSIEAILKERIISNFTTLTGNFQEGIAKLLNENAIIATDPDRDFSRLVFEASEDPIILALTVDRQFFGNYVYDAIADLCLAVGVGFKITLREDGKLVFKLYAGVDRSNDQEINPHVVFSPEFDNLASSDYLADNTNSKTTTLVVGNGEGDSQVKLTVNASLDGPGTDLDRREMYTDATSIVKVLPTGTLTEEEYLAQLQKAGEDYINQMKQLGKEDLSKNGLIETFSGEIVNESTLYIFGRDFFMGDIVQLEDAYLHKSKSRVTELVHSEDAEGPKIYPTFTNVV